MSESVSRSPRASSAGFTLVELFVVMLIAGILGLFGYPALMNTVNRARIEGAAREASSFMRAARLEAVKRGQQVGVQVHLTERHIGTFLDVDEDGTLSAGDTEIGHRYNLPGTVAFGGPTGDAAPLLDFTNDGTKGWAIFNSDGSVEQTGGVRLTDGRGNHLEVKVDPRSTGRVALRKWNGTTWREQGENEETWQFN